MRAFLRYLSVLLLLIAVSWVKIPQWYSMEFPRSPGPQFDREMRRFYISRLDTEQPAIVLLGDSTLTDGIDVSQLSELTGEKISKFDVPGSASAFWYLVLKNNIIDAQHLPKVVVIIFRDTMLTAPGYRVYGGYFTQLDEFAQKREPLVMERSYLNLMNPLEKLSEEYFPLYGGRGQIRKQIDGSIRYSVPRWLNCDQDCTDQSMYAVLQAADLERGQLQNAIASAEEYLYTPDQLNFARQVNRSYLPEMIRLTKENGIQLILVRLKSGIRIKGNHETMSVKKYVTDLSSYLDAQNISLLDYGADPRLTSEDYKDPLHLNSKGRIVFTHMLADGLNSLLHTSP